MSSNDPGDADWRLKALPCGHQVGQVDQSHYCTYIGWGAMRPMAEVAHAGTSIERPFHNEDERMFVVVHQMAELGLTHVLYSLELARGRLGIGEIERATRDLHVAIKWLDHVGKTAWLLNSMDTALFMKPSPEPGVKPPVGFRDLVVPASGAESGASREVELLFGMRADSPYMEVHGRVLTFRQVMDLPPGMHGRGSRWWTTQMDRRSTEPSVVDAFKGLIDRHGLALAILVEVDPKTEDPLRLLVSALWNFEKAMLRLRKIHYKLAANQFKTAEAEGYIAVSAEDLAGTGVPGDRKLSAGGEMPAALKYLAAAFRTARLYPELFNLMQDRDPTLPGLLDLHEGPVE